MGSFGCLMGRESYSSSTTWVYRPGGSSGGGGPSTKPEVMMVGEIRDRGTAETVFQASLTGHLVLTTFHAGSAAQAVNRLSDMGIEPYLLRAGVRAIVCQRLLRRLCACAKSSAEEEHRLGLSVGVVRVPAGCLECGGTGYRGRFVLTEMLLPQESRLGRAILSRGDAREL